LESAEAGDAAPAEWKDRMANAVAKRMILFMPYITTRPLVT
jgi:hypothetical protein